jgi:CubicO group peptidase (beta-lactamase class C family)
MVPDLIFKKGLDFTPGTQFSYDNSGYYLLGLIIEKVTGKSYEEEVRNIIFQPLGMTHSFFDFRNSKDTNRATGYRKLNINEQVVAQRWDSTVTYAAVGIFSTTGDMYLWAKAVANIDILSAASWEAAFTPYLEHYGYGWFIDTLYGERSVSHGGGLPGYMADFTYYPDRDVTIILLNNEGYYGEGLTDINAALSAILFHRPNELMHVRTEVKLADSILKKYVGEYAFDKKHHAFITLENGTLQMEAPAGNLPKSPLFPQDETNMYLKIIDARIEFVRDVNGNITGFVSHYNGKDEACKKVK